MHSYTMVSIITTTSKITYPFAPICCMDFGLLFTLTKILRKTALVQLQITNFCSRLLIDFTISTICSHGKKKKEHQATIMVNVFMSVAHYMSLLMILHCSYTISWFGTSLLLQCTASWNVIYNMASTSQVAKTNTRC